MVQMSTFGAFVAILATALVAADSNDAIALAPSSSTSCSSSLPSSTSTSCTSSSSSSSTAPLPTSSSTIAPLITFTNTTTTCAESISMMTPSNSSMITSSTPVTTITTTMIEDITTSGPVALNTSSGSFVIPAVWPKNMTVGDSSARVTAAVDPASTLLSSYMGVANGFAARPGAVAVAFVAAGAGFAARMMM